MQDLIHLSQGVARLPEWQLASPADFTLCDGEHIAIVGDNGSGKSMLVDMLTGSHPLSGGTLVYDFAPSASVSVARNIKHIRFRDTYGSDSDRTYYLQQRWNQAEIDEQTPTVADVLAKAQALANAEGAATDQKAETLFGLDEFRDKYVITLSSGELRKLTIATALCSRPRVLIIDNPFIGLDAETRELFKSMLKTLARQCRLQIVIVLSKPDDIPDFITHVVSVAARKVGEKQTVADFLSTRPEAAAHVLDPQTAEAILSLPDDAEEAAEEVIGMHGVSITYGNRHILEQLDWTVRNGECWALTGRNGSGKSTLLSLVCADNPQSYACDITLFGRKRGGGESIWDIKRRIGYVSPEMHRAFKHDMPVAKVVASGLHDTMGQYARIKDGDLERCRFWLGVFGIADMEGRSFLRLSSGEQRLALLARAFVKDPSLLILDEPLHGLDNRNSRRVKDIIETFCRRRNKTLVMVTHYREDFPQCIKHEKTLTRITEN